MKNYLILLTLLVFISFSGAYFYLRDSKPKEPVADKMKPQIADIKQDDKSPFPEETTSMSNPASDNCINKGGVLEIITEKDGSQFGLCDLKSYKCEEWALLRGECDVINDEAKIKNALIAKGLKLIDMKVVIQKHLGKNILGSVVPEIGYGGGGYVFAVKDNDGEIKVLADGNGMILCSAFVEYPDFPTYLLPECIDENGNVVER